MTTMFYKEARRLWDLEEDQDSLTKLQAGICLCKYSCFPLIALGNFFRLRYFRPLTVVFSHYCLTGTPVELQPLMLL